MQDQKKILFISAFPPGDKTAGQNYTRLLLEDLAKHGHKIDVFFFKYGDHRYEPEHPGITVLTARPLGTKRKLLNIAKLLLLHPFFTSRLSVRLIWFISRNSSRYDLVYLDFSQVFLYGLFIPGSRQYLMLHDVVYQKYTRRAGALQSIAAKWIFLSEKLVLSGKRQTLLTFSEKDRELIKAWYGKDAKVVSPFLAPMILDLKEADFTESDYFCFYGAWNRNENTEGLHWFFEHVYPGLRTHVRIRVIGGGMSAKDKAVFSTIPGVELLGFVENPYPVLAGARALIAPLFQGAGVKFKVLEALACGTTVVGTEIALEGIAADLSEGLIKCTTGQDFIREINKQAAASRTAGEKIDLHRKTISVYTRGRFSEMLG